MGWLFQKSRLGKSFAHKCQRLSRKVVGCFHCNGGNRTHRRIAECQRKCIEEDISHGCSEAGIAGSHGQELQQVFMDDTLWSSLPSDLLDKVLACLPIPALFRARLVCRRWNDLVYSHNFLRIWSETAYKWGSCLPVFFMSDGEELLWSAYDFSSERWQQMPPPLPALGTHKDNFYVRGAGGLLCVGVWGKQEIDTLIICNPVTKHWRPIPPPAHKWRPFLLQLVVNETTKAYKIILAGDLDARLGNHTRYRRTEVYDSSLGSWMEAAGLPPDLYMALDYGVFSNGFLYCVALSGYTGLQLAGILAFDVEHGVWRDSPYVLPEPAASGTSSREARVVECRGNIVTIVEEICRENGQVQGSAISIYQLEMVSKQWIKIAQMPQPLFFDLYDNYGSDGEDILMGCVGQGDKICIINKLSCAVVVYDVAKQSWRALPNFDDNLHWRRQQFYVQSMGFSFEMRFDAPV